MAGGRSGGGGLVYNAAYQQPTAIYGKYAILPPASGTPPPSAEMAISQKVWFDNLWLIGLPCVRNRLYRVVDSGM